VATHLVPSTAAASSSRVMIDRSDPARAPAMAVEPPGELADFLAVMDQHERRVASVVGRFLDDPRDIEEAVQDTFMQAWRHRHAFRADAAVFTWLYRIATNTALMRLRRQRPVPLPIEHVAGDTRGLATDPMADHPDLLDTVDQVRRALAALPAHYRVVVILRDVEGLSNREAADVLGLPVTTIKAHLHRGRSRLRRDLHGPRRRASDG
jgi:RNA polymerase sigma-70 factor (ECF subfamily)